MQNLTLNSLNFLVGQATETPVELAALQGLTVLSASCQRKSRPTVSRTLAVLLRGRFSVLVCRPLP